MTEKRRPSFYDTPPYQYGGHFYDHTPEGKTEQQNRLKMGFLLKPGDAVIVDYAFGRHSEPEIKAGTQGVVVGWDDMIFGEGDENLIYTEPHTR